MIRVVVVLVALFAAALVAYQCESGQTCWSRTGYGYYYGQITYDSSTCGTGPCTCVLKLCGLSAGYPPCCDRDSSKCEIWGYGYCRPGCQPEWPYCPYE